MATPKQYEADKALIEAAMMLRMKQPEAWNDFVRALGTASAQATERMLSTTGEMLVKAQGAALQMKAHHEMMSNVAQLHDKMRQLHAQNATKAGHP